VFLIELVFSNSARKMGDLRPKHRGPLIAKKLITLDERGSRKFIVPTEAAWDWVAANLDLGLVRTRPGRALSAVLARLRDYLASRELALADFVQPPSHAKPPAETLDQRIRAAYLAHTRGKFHTRMRLTALRSMLADTARPVLDAELRQLSARGGDRAVSAR